MLRVSACLASAIVDEWGEGEGAYEENGNASSRAKAYAIRVSANMAEQPVKNCTSVASPHIIVPPVFPPALRKICAAGRPVGVFKISSRSVTQKHRQTVNIQPIAPETRTAVWMARGPKEAALWVSSDILYSWLTDGNRELGVGWLLCRPVIVCHCPCDGEETQEEGEYLGAPS